MVTTAAAFAKGFLDLDGALTPIIHSLVRSDPAVDTLLDDAHYASAHLKDVKKRLHEAIKGSDKQTRKYLCKLLAPTGSNSLVNSIKLMRTPMKALERLRELIGTLVEQLKVVWKQYRSERDHLKNKLKNLVRYRQGIRGEEKKDNNDNEDDNNNDDDDDDMFRSATATLSCQPTSPSSSPKQNRSRGGSNMNNNDDGDKSSQGMSKEVGEGIGLIYARWKKLNRDLCKVKKDKKDKKKKKKDKDGKTGSGGSGGSGGGLKWDFSKIPDIYDCIKYDVIHNHETLLRMTGVPELYVVAKSLADVVIPQEYGMTATEKLGIGVKICQPLLRKIISDFRSVTTLNDFQHESVYRLDSRYGQEMNIRSMGRHVSGGQVGQGCCFQSTLILVVLSCNTHFSCFSRFCLFLQVRTRLYFTSESHVHALLNVLRYGSIADKLSQNMDEWSPGNSDSGSSSPETSPSRISKGDASKFDPDRPKYPEQSRYGTSTTIDSVGEKETGKSVKKEISKKELAKSIDTLDNKTFLGGVQELSYLTHIVIRLFELTDDPTVETTPGTVVAVAVFALLLSCYYYFVTLRLCLFLLLLLKLIFFDLLDILFSCSNTHTAHTHITHITHITTITTIRNNDTQYSTAAKNTTFAQRSLAS